MENKRRHISLVCLLYLSCVTCGLDVKTEVVLVQYGNNVTLKCILLPPNTAGQVTWTKVIGDQETTVGRSSSDSGDEISDGYKKRARISTSGLNETTITIYHTNIQDEGCYRCIFTTSTKESKKGDVCFTFPGEVLVKKHHRVRLFQPVTLTCIKRTKTNVVQITWNKNGVSIATYSKEVHDVQGYEGILNVTKEDGDLSTTSLTLFRANVSSDGNYSCMFNSFPGGSDTGETSLQVYEPLNVTLSKNQVSGSLTITCEARSWPPSTISWLDVDEGSLNCTTYGLQTVTSWIQISSQQKKMPKCKVLHLGEESLFHVSSGARCRLHPVIIVLLLSKIFLL